MSEMTKRELLAEFCAMAKGAIPNTEESIAAQTFFKLKLVGTSDKDARNAHLQNKTLQDAFINAVADLAKHVTQSELFAAQSYDDIKSRLPQEHQNPLKGVGQVLRRLEVQFGIREPQFGCGK